MGYSVGQVAGFARVTVRTLHYYDETGLLSPSTRSRAGHRRYDDGDLTRLQQILFYRELGFSLDQVAAVLDDPGADPVAHLRHQHELLRERIGRLERMAAAVERAMERERVGGNLTPEERFEVFGDFEPADHAEEAGRRWGDTDAYRQSQRRTAGYTKEDWLRLKEQNEDWGRRFGAAMDTGAAAESPEAMDLAEEHRRQISRWFYDCSYEIQTGLAEMYVADERFRRYYQEVKPGMAEYLRDAILANAVRSV